MTDRAHSHSSRMGKAAPAVDGWNSDPTSWGAPGGCRAVILLTGKIKAERLQVWALLGCKMSSRSAHKRPYFRNEKNKAPRCNSVAERVQNTGLWPCYVHLFVPLEAGFWAEGHGDLCSSQSEPETEELNVWPLASTLRMLIDVTPTQACKNAVLPWAHWFCPCHHS